MDVQTLEGRIRQAAQAYYEGHPLLSDGAFDRLGTQLAVLDPGHALLTTPGWGYDPGTAPLTTGHHVVPMGSLPKVKYHQRHTAPFCAGPVVASLKLDGGAACAIYAHGVLQRVLSRGDGKVGLDITQNLRHGVPAVMQQIGIVAVRGEVLLTEAGFGAVGGASPRNRAVGLSQSLYANRDEVRHLRFVAYDLPVRTAACPILDKQGDLEFLRSQGFTVVPYRLYSSWNAFLDLSPTSLHRYEQGYPVDGMVISAMRPEVQIIPHGVAVHYPSVAVKYPDASAVTTVKDVCWQVTRTRRLVPVALVEPVQLADATVRRVTLHNVMWARERGIGIGASVAIVRSHMVIPRIVEVLVSAPVVCPATCPRCGQSVTVVSRDLVCRNTSCAPVA
jgi:DNA ligase (NAD+)